MAKFDTIKTAIDANINTNGNQAITGSVMNSVLKQMVDSTDAELTELESEVSSNKVFDIDEFNTIGKNFYESVDSLVAESSVNGWINKNTGDIVYAENFTTVTYKVKPNSIYIISSMVAGAGGNSAPYAFYDSNGSFIKSYWQKAQKGYDSFVIFTPFNADIVKISGIDFSPLLYSVKNSYNEFRFNLEKQYQALDTTAGAMLEHYDITPLLIKGHFIYVKEDVAIDYLLRKNPEWKCLYIKVTNGQKITLTNVVGGANGRAYALYDVDGNFLESAAANATINETFTIKQNGFLVVNTKSNSTKIYSDILILQNEFLVPFVYSYAINAPSFVDAQEIANETKEKLNNILQDSHVPFTNGYISISDGYVVPNTSDTNWNHSDFIPVEDYSKFEVSLKGSASANVALLSFYEDKNKNSILAEYTNNSASYSGIVTRPSKNAKYVRFCGQSDAFGGAGTYKVTVISPLKELAEKTEELAEKTEELAEKLHLKLLVIGNSYSIDSFSYVPFILKEYGVTIELGIYYYGGAALNTHVQMWDSATLEFYYINTKTDTAWRKYTSYNPLKSVQFTDWDIVTLQQSSIASVNANNYEPWARRLINLILDNTTKPVQFAWNININRKSSGDDLTAIANQILQNIESVCNREPINIIFPYGTAIFNARTNDMLDAIGDGGHLWASDETHIQDGLPCYIAALANTQALFNKFYPQFSVMGDKTRPTEDKLNEWAVPWREGVSVGINEENCRLAQICAILANNEKFKISTIYGNV